MKSGYLNLCVEVEGKDLEEHEIATNERETTCWIASEEGKVRSNAFIAIKMYNERIILRNLLSTGSTAFLVKQSPVQ